MPDKPKIPKTPFPLSTDILNTGLEDSATITYEAGTPVIQSSGPLPPLSYKVSHKVAIPSSLAPAPTGKEEKEPQKP
jgi:hypothetical protein